VKEQRAKNVERFGFYVDRGAPDAQDAAAFIELALAESPEVTHGLSPSLEFLESSVRTAERDPE
jgi:hypothetical protein